MAASSDAGTDASADASPSIADDDQPAAVKFASIAELLGLGGKAPVDVLAGYQLGQPATVVFKSIAIPGWWGTARAVLRDGKVSHIVVELGTESATDQDDGTLSAKAFAGVKSDITKSWGAARKGLRDSWRSDGAQMFLVEYGGFLRGTPSLVIDLLPVGETHVCGANDGFAAFFTEFKKALAAKNAAALAKLTYSDPNNDMEVCANPGAGKTYFDCVAPELKRMAQKPVCAMSREIYYWAAREENTHGGSFFVFKRDGSTWKAQGPLGIGHDDDPNPTAP